MHGADFLTPIENSMKRILLKLLAAIAVAFGFAVPTQAILLTFEDVRGGLYMALGVPLPDFPGMTLMQLKLRPTVATRATFISFDRAFPGGVDKVRFNNNPNALVFDDLTVNGANVPAPATLATLGLSGFAALRRKSGENTDA
jgi:hypothetical protein